MSNEREWVDSIIADIERAMQAVALPGVGVRVQTGVRLPYAYEVLTYEGKAAAKTNTNAYETDILISDIFEDDRWVPRVIVECKLKSVTTHDSITYSTKASTHKNVHPYVRYGILLGDRDDHPLPGRLIRHGSHFDFMAQWRDAKPNETEWYSFIGILTDEVKASRALQDCLTTSRKHDRRHYHFLHRKLELQ